MTVSQKTGALERILGEIGSVAVAVSGGVDSMTLAHVAHRALGTGATMIHARSPAVPKSASERVTRHAERAGWRLMEIDAGEFADSRYRANPANRCYFCKTNLYGTMAAQTEAALVSGTNLDDLGDWRPGLKAADEHCVRHPFVEAGIDKACVRAIARRLGLDDLAELPAAPCLSSRVETGIFVEAKTLASIDRVETSLRDRLQPQTVRCRVVAKGIRIELDPGCFDRLGPDDLLSARQVVSNSFAGVNPDDVVIAPYRRGSAFLR
ncbi:MAG: adenine nucleotide alpha hydrolase [Pseudomonadota bacterium]